MNLNQEGEKKMLKEVTKKELLEELSEHLETFKKKNTVRIDSKTK